MLLKKQQLLPLHPHTSQTSSKWQKGEGHYTDVKIADHDVRGARSAEGSCAGLEKGKMQNGT